MLVELVALLRRSRASLFVCAPRRERRAARRRGPATARRGARRLGLVAALGRRRPRRPHRDLADARARAAPRRARSAPRATREPLAALMPRLRDEGVRAVSPNGVLGDPAGATRRGGPRAARGARSRPRAFRRPRRGAQPAAAPLDARDRAGERESPRPRRAARRAAARGTRRRRAPRRARHARGGRCAASPRGSRSSPARRAGSAPRPCGGSRPTAGTWSRSTAPRTTRGSPTRWARPPSCCALGERAGASRSRADATDARALGGRGRDAERRWGGLDAIVAAAGVIAGGVHAWELDAEQERAVLEVNLGGVLTAARVGIPALLRRPEPREGRFIAVASTAATRGLPKLAAYCAAKAGVTGFVRALAVELGGTGVTANAVSPGSTRTPILDESARLYGLDRRRGVRRPAAARPAARARGGRGADLLAGGPAEPRRDRRRLPARRRPLPLARLPVRKAQSSGCDRVARA